MLNDQCPVKTAILVVKWLVRLGVLVALAYFLRPMYAPSKPTIPSSIGPNDFVTWKLSSDPDPVVTQTLKVYGTGSNTVTIVRRFLDPDIPMDGGWKLSRDKAAGTVGFSKENLIPDTRALGLVRDSLQAGLLDARSISAAKGDGMTIQSSFGATAREISGPQSTSATMEFDPDAWQNRMRWQKLGRLIQGDATVRALLARTEVKLVDDDKVPQGGGRAEGLGDRE